MRQIAIASLKEGFAVARPVYNAQGGIVVPQGSILTSHHIEKLSGMGISAVFVDDPYTEGLIVEEVLTEELRIRLFRCLRHAMAALRLQSSFAGDGLDLRELHRLTTAMLQQLSPCLDREIVLTQTSSYRDYEAQHPINVAVLSYITGRALGLNSQALEDLLQAALLQNIGYVFLPPDLIDREGELTPSELEKMRAHPEKGYQLLKATKGLNASVMATVYQHHERWDGSGYPLGLAGDRIYPLARILAVADTYDALISERPYRRAYMPHEAIEYVMGFGGEQFDYYVVDAFTRNTPSYNVGTRVRLNSGDEGFVVKSNRGLVARPKVRVFWTEDGRELPKPYEIDLSLPQNQSKLVVAVVNA